MRLEYSFDSVYLTIEVSDGSYKDKIQISRDDFLQWLNVEERQLTTKDLFKSP